MSIINKEINTNTNESIKNLVYSLIADYLYASDLNKAKLHSFVIDEVFDWDISFCQNTAPDITLRDYGKEIDKLLDEDGSFREYFREEIDSSLIENNQERFNKLIYENLIGASYDIIYNDFPYTIYGDACNYFVVNENSSLNSFDYHPANILCNNIGDVVHDVAPDFNYGINLNYFTDKFFKGRDDKSNSSQESPKKDTFDIDK